MPLRKLAFRVRALTVACTNLNRSQHFYATVLGATPLPSDVGTCRWFRLGSLDITLMPNAVEPSPAKFPTHAMPILWLEVEDLPAARKRFAEHKVTVIDEGDENFMQIADPDGLAIEVWQIEQ